MTSVGTYRARVANLLLRAAAGGPLCGIYALSPAAVLGQIAPRPYRCPFGGPIQKGEGEEAATGHKQRVMLHLRGEHTRGKEFKLWRKAQR
jgi:hypothetical protein